MVMTRNVEVRSMLDGKTYTDARAYERHVRENGYEIAGNDTAALIAPPKPSGAKNVRETVRKARARLNP